MDKKCSTCVYDVNQSSWCNSCIRNPKGRFDAWTIRPSLKPNIKKVSQES